MEEVATLLARRRRQQKSSEVNELKGMIRNLEKKVDQHHQSILQTLAANQAATVEAVIAILKSETPNADEKQALPEHVSNGHDDPLEAVSALPAFVIQLIAVLTSYTPSLALISNQKVNEKCRGTNKHDERCGACPKRGSLYCRSNQNQA